MFQTKVVEEIKTHILCSVTFFFLSKIVPFVRKCRKILWSRTGHRWQYGACALYAGYLRLQTTLPICNSYCFSIATMFEPTCLNVTLYVHYLNILLELNCNRNIFTIVCRGCVLKIGVQNILLRLFRENLCSWHKTLFFISRVLF